MSCFSTLNLQEFPHRVSSWTSNLTDSSPTLRCSGDVAPDAAAQNLRAAAYSILLGKHTLRFLIKHRFYSTSSESSDDALLAFPTASTHAGNQQLDLGPNGQSSVDGCQIRDLCTRG